MPIEGNSKTADAIFQDQLLIRYLVSALGCATRGDLLGAQRNSENARVRSEVLTREIRSSMAND